MAPGPLRRVLVIVSLVLGALGCVGAAAAATIDPRIAYLAADPAKHGPDFAGSLRFESPPDGAQLDAIARLGVRFGEHHSRTIYPARIPLASLAALARRRDLVAVECEWRVPGPPPLLETRIRVESDLAQRVPSPLGGTLSGLGVTIAQFDTGVEREHMALQQLSRDLFAWLDLDGDGAPGAGDAVDLDGDGLPGPNESLFYRETLGIWSHGNVFGRFDPEWDLLFNDLDQDGERDLEPRERLFVADDRDGDGRLAPDEPVIGLGQSKIRAVRDADGTVYRRGVDLPSAPGDTWAHGTCVAGILAAGWPDRHRMVGTAPGAELLEIMVEFADEPPFVSSFTDHLAWAVAEGADVVLVEDGEWVWEYLDGSSNFEIMLGEYAAEGLIVVVPVGNLATGHMHCRFRSGDAQSIEVAEGATASWPTLLWTAPVDLSLAITPPLGETVALPLDGTVVQEAGYAVYSQHSVSPRGTHRIDLALHTGWPGGGIQGTWRFHVTGPDCELHGYVFDDASGWISDSRWETGEDPTTTATWPATADSAIVVAAFDIFAEPGVIRDYSSRGPRIDGAAVVDLAAPNLAWSSDPSRWNGYAAFAGTSCAAPYVAGAAALLKELDPTLDHGRCRRYLRAGAIATAADPHAGGVGDLSVMGAVSLLLDELSDQPVPTRLAMSAYPNPFNAGTVIRYRQLERGAARVRVFDVAGREVWHHEVASGPAGWREVAWDGRDRDGAPAASGVYIAHVASSGQAAAGKVTLVR